MEQIGNINFDKYNTFFLQYYKEKNQWLSHFVRPCVAKYDEIVDVSKNRVITLESAILTFKNEETLSEILLKCALFGVNVDFIDVYVKEDEKNKFPWSDDKLVQQIDTHKEDLTKYVDEIEFPRHYVAVNKSKNNPLKFLVIDRFTEKTTNDFLHGKYDKKAVIAGFKEHSEAKTFCDKMNKS